MASPVDYSALAEQARKNSPVDYAALAERARSGPPPAHYESGWKVTPEQPFQDQPHQDPGFWEEGGTLHRFIHNSPLGPVLNWPETLGKLRDQTGAQMQKYLNDPNLGNAIGSIPIVGPMLHGEHSIGANIERAQQNPTPGNLVESVPVVGPIARTAVQQVKSGDVAGGLGTATNLAPMVWPGVSTVAGKVKSLKENNPDVALANAVNASPAHTSFPEELPNIRANVKAGEQITGVPIKDVPTALQNTDASMTANRAALETHKDLQRNLGTQFDTSVLKRAMIDAIPKGLKNRGAINPNTGLSEYDSAVAEINSLYPKRYVGVDELFNQLEEANNRLHAFYSGKQGAQASKLVTNMGDTSVLKAEGDAARKYLYDTMGQDAADLQSNWGEMNGFKHYLQDKVNPAFRQKPFSPLDRIASAIDSPASGQGLKHGIARNIVDTVIGKPKTIDGLIEDAFNNTQPANLPQPVAQTPFSPFGGPTNPPGGGPALAQLPAGPPVPNTLPSSGQTIITPQNPQQAAATAFSGAVGQRPSGSAVSNADAGYRALPPATTRFQGDISPGAAFGGTGEMRDLPTASDSSGVTDFYESPAPFRVGFPASAPRQISAPAPGQPPVNILPRRTDSTIGPGSPVMTTSTETPIPLPKAGNSLGLDEQGRPVRPPTLNREQRRAGSAPPEEGAPEDVARSQSMGTTKAEELNIARRLGQKIRQTLDTPEAQ